MNIDPDWREQLGTAAAVLIAATLGVRKWLRRDRAEVANESAYSIAIVNMREEIERLAKLNDILHKRVADYQEETLRLHAKIETISREMIEIAREKDEMKSELSLLRDRMHHIFSSCGDCRKMPQIAGWVYQQ